MGIAHGMTGYRFFILNSLIAIPAVLALLEFEDSSTLPRIFNLVQLRPIRTVDVPSSHMKPTIPPGAWVLTNMIIPVSQIRVGDIVTFYRIGSGGSETLSIMRLIGKGGDKIQMVDGILQINGRPVRREQIEDFLDEGNSHVKQYRETLPNGTSFNTIDLVENGFLDNTEVFNVPQDHYFFMGDNRDNAADSRMARAVGFVPAKNLVGKAYFVLYPRALGYLYKRE
jgi:signal peptidase I